MYREVVRHPSLLRAYQSYLTDGESSRFVTTIAKCYSVETLARLTRSVERLVRRAAVLSIGMLGDISLIDVVGPLLADSDRRVRLVADDAMKSLWHRAAEPAARIMLERILIHLESNQVDQALATADRFVELYRGCPKGTASGIDSFQSWKHREAKVDCEKCLERSPYSYMAHVGLGQCWLEQDDPRESLAAFQKALSIYPDLDTVRIQVRRLEGVLSGAERKTETVVAAIVDWNKLQDWLPARFSVPSLSHRITGATIATVARLVSGYTVRWLDCQPILARGLLCKSHEPSRRGRTLVRFAA